MAELPLHLSGLMPDGKFTDSATPNESERNPTSIPGTLSFTEQFLDSFLQERNIRWLLLMGAAIVFGSSLMLVTKAWAGWTPVVKFLSILSYTGAIFVSAEVARRRLNLKTTYTVLYGLTLLLMQISFMALMWLSAASGTHSALQTIELIGLLLPAAGFLWIASRRILDHLLGGRQSTFLNCYRVLCFAGYLPRFDTETGAFAFLLGCWAVFTIGVLKVNRHTFWLAEERRYPRVFGFLPILMLGLQFLILIGTKSVSALPLQWIGFCCVLVSFTILMTSRAVIDVFRQRTGDLIRPLPWNIFVPVFFGTVLTIAGVVFSFAGFRPVGTTTCSVIPAAAMASFLMWMMAKDFRSSVFLWAGLIFATISYQCTPTLFSEILFAIRTDVAGAIREDRLPIAFYGLTYLPLIAVVAAGSRWYVLTNDLIFSRTMKHFASLLSVVLFVLSLTHIKAAFLVALVNVPAFIVLALLFRDRRYVIPSVAAAIIAAGTGIPALTQMGATTIPDEFIPVALAALSMLMTSTRVADRILNRIPVADNNVLRHLDGHGSGLSQYSLILQHADGTGRNLVQMTGGFVAAVMSCHWLRSAALTYHDVLTGPQLIQFGLLLAALLIYALRHPRYLTGLGLWVMIAVGGLRFVVGLDPSLLQVLNEVTVVSAGMSLLAYAGLRFSRLVTSRDQFRSRGIRTGQCSIQNPLTEPGGNLAFTLLRTFLVPLCDLSLVLMACLVAVVHLPMIVRAHGVVVSTSLACSLPISTGLAVAWLTAVSILFRSRTAAAVTTLAVPLWVTAAMISSSVPVAATWLPCIWAVIHGVAGWCCHQLHRSASLPECSEHPSGIAVAKIPGNHSVSLIVAQISEAVLMGIVILSCLSFSIRYRVAAAVALLSLTAVDVHRRLDRSQITWLAVITNLQLFLLMAALGGCSGSVVGIVAGGYPTASLPWIFLTAAVSLPVFDRMSADLEPVICGIWTALIRAGMVVLAAMSLVVSHCPSAQVLMMTSGFAVTVIAEFVHAVRCQRAAHVWSGVSAAATGFLFLLTQGMIQCGLGMSQIVLLAGSVLALVAAKSVQSRSRLAIMHAPLSMIGNACPALVTCMAIGRQMAGMETLMESGNSMIVMAASAIYFQQAMVTRQRRFAVLALAVLNAALMLLFSSLHLSHVEFFLVPAGLSILGFVELFARELPSKTHDPLRYLGALTILVSPMFDILDGSWGHVLSLLLLSILVMLLAIGLRLKSLVYAGSAFLLMDLLVMVVRSQESYPFIPWLCGIAAGAGVIGIAAFCENHREQVLSRIRMLSAELATWR